MADESLRILAIGAHPDDCEVSIGATAAMWAAAGHTVRFVSATNGETGHHEQGGAAIATRRIAEAAEAAKVLGVESLVLPIPNGQIEPTLPYRRLFIKTIREFRPDLVVTNRPNDYHPDHRYTSQLVQDSAYIVTVPNNCPETPALRKNPVMAYWCDDFTRPYPFDPTVVIDIDPAIDRKFDALHCHESQMYEWIPWTQGTLGDVPSDGVARRMWLMQQRAEKYARRGDRYREQLVARYGPERGKAVKHIEAFEACEYGSPLDGVQIERFFAGM